MNILNEIFERMKRYNRIGGSGKVILLPRSCYPKPKIHKVIDSALNENKIEDSHPFKLGNLRMF